MDPNMKEKKWYLRWWSVFLWFATVGPFGLPFLWKSKDFSLFWKWFWTIAMVVITAFLIWSTWKIVVLMIDQLKSAGLI